MAGAAKKRGPVPQGPDPRVKRIIELERETARWRKRAERAEAPNPERPRRRSYTKLGNRLSHSH